MRQRLESPIVLRRIRLEGPTAAREVDMLFDTGAAYTTISWEVAKDLGYDPAGSPERVSLVTANGMIEAPKLSVQKVVFRELSIRHVDVICHDIPELAGLEGLVGLSFLQNFRVLLDFKKGILEIK